MNPAGDLREVSNSSLDGIEDFDCMFQSVNSASAGYPSQPTLSQLQQIGRGVSIMEQPKSRGLRFRYECEGRSAGSIPGEHSKDTQKTFPSIQIHNMPPECKSAIVVVSCVSKDEPPKPHPHSLVGKDCSKGVCTVKVKNSDFISFSQLGIQCVRKKDILPALDMREKIRVDPYSTGFNHKNGNIDLNVVRLCFQVFLPNDKGKYQRVVAPVVSHCIYDKKTMADMVIFRISRQAGSVRGGDEVFMLCEKVQKEDIQVRFYEESTEGVIWESFGEFGQQDVHRQVAIVFKTPPYRLESIQQPVELFMQLKRPSDGETSEPVKFQYMPQDPDPEGVEMKRKKKKVPTATLR